MTEILNNEYYSAIVVLFSQIGFVYLRTINVIYTAEKRILGAIITGNGIGLTWLITMSIGANSIMQGHWLPILCFLIGGSVGTYLGIKQEKNKKQ